MRRLAFAPAVLALLVAVSVGQEKDTPKAKGQLPANWKQLGLSDEQKQKVYEIQSATKTKVDALEQQIKELKDKQTKDLDKVLTDAQRARLKEILTKKVGGGDDKK